MLGGTWWIKRLLCFMLLVGTFATALASSAQAQEPAVQASGFSVRDGRLIDGYGNDFVVRGINHAHTWFQDELGALEHIKATGANTVRVVLSTGAQFERTNRADVALIVDRCRSARLVCVLGVHDTTGFPGSPGSISLAEAVDYWRDMLPVLEGHEDAVIVNIGNEPFDNELFQGWAQDTSSAIGEMRNAGFQHTLMVDAPNWGQDLSFTMRDNAATVFESDADRNVVFDVHMFGLFDDSDKVRSYIESFVRSEVPLVIGEFGPSHPSGDTDEASILHWASLYGIGYVGWSWSGNVDPVPQLNVVEAFDSQQVTPWGERLIDGLWGISMTSAEASVFGPVGSRPSPLLATPPAAEPAPPPDAELQMRSRHEAEGGVRNGLLVSIRGVGYSGTGYVSEFDTAGDSLRITVHADQGGTYDLVFGYRSRFDTKTQQLVVNNQRMGSIVFPFAEEFTTTTYQDVELVTGGNEIMVEHDWGWFDLDYVEVWGPATD